MKFLWMKACAKWLHSELHPHPDGVDVALVAWEGLSAHTLSDVPQLGGEVARPGDELVEVRGHGKRHGIPQVTSEHRLLCAGLDVPQHARPSGGGKGGCKWRSWTGQAAPEVTPRSDLQSGSSRIHRLPSAVPWAGDDLAVTDETAAWQVTWRPTEELHG